MQPPEAESADKSDALHTLARNSEAAGKMSRARLECARLQRRYPRTHPRSKGDRFRGSLDLQDWARIEAGVRAGWFADAGSLLIL